MISKDMFSNIDYISGIKKDTPDNQLYFFRELRQLIEARSKILSDYDIVKAIADSIVKIRMKPIRAGIGGDQNVKSKLDLYRARKINFRELQNISQITYPPADICKSFQRCNSIGRTALYASTDEHTVFTEIDASDGDTLTYAKIITRSELKVMVLGHLDHIRRHKRSFLPGFIVSDTSPIIEILNSNDDKALVVKVADAFIAYEFSRKINSENTSNYMLTSAITEILLDARYGNSDERLFDAVIYPSVKNIGGHNIVISPDMFDEKCAIQELAAKHIVSYEDYGLFRNRQAAHGLPNNNTGDISWREIGIQKNL